MCGIVAVSGVPEAAKLAYLGLYSLQHRGQEAAGIVSIHSEPGGEVGRIHRGTGLVAEAFNEEILARLEGATALGHIRYSTAGGAGPSRRQHQPTTPPPSGGGPPRSELFVCRARS
jgi:amidophosphoribosyltransferase